METINHVLPGETGDISWFEERQNSFEKKVILQQVAFRNDHWPELVDGRDINNPAHTYPHILPSGCEFLAVYEPIAFELFSYLSEEDIEIHSGLRNLKSSQAACFNILFPLKQNLQLAVKVLGEFLPNLKAIDSIEFEYTGPPDITEWLGEPPYGKRGKKRTSIDAAIYWNDNKKTHISLIEWKFTERNFGTCSMYGKKEFRQMCEEINLSSNTDPDQLCPLVRQSKDTPRRYWEHMAVTGINPEKLQMKGCPFSTPLYQIMRQFEVAAYLRENRCADEVEVVLFTFRGNTELLEVPKTITTEYRDIISLWNSVLDNVPPLRLIYVDNILENIEQYCEDTSWCEYLEKRYRIRDEE